MRYLQDVSMCTALRTGPGLMLKIPVRDTAVMYTWQHWTRNRLVHVILTKLSLWLHGSTPPGNTGYTTGWCIHGILTKPSLWLHGSTPCGNTIHNRWVHSCYIEGTRVAPWFRPGYGFMGDWQDLGNGLVVSLCLLH